MQNTALFEAALGITKPWYIESVNFDPQAAGSGLGEINISINFFKGSTFLASDEQEHKAFDTHPRTWKHLNFFQHVCYLHAQVPRVKLADGKVETVAVPWSRPGSNFTLLFEAYIMLLIKGEMSLSQTARMADISRDSVERIFNHYVEKGIKAMNCTNLTTLGIDETSSKRGHKYVTIGVDMDTRSVVAVSQGKDTSAVKDLKDSLIAKGADTDKIDLLSMDMSPAYIKGAALHFQNAAITFDKFHIVKLINEAVDATRRIEQVAHGGLKKTRYQWLVNNESLSKMDQDQLGILMHSYPNMGKVYRLKLQFKTFWQSQHVVYAEAFIKQWISQARAIGNFPFDKLAQTMERNLKGILAYVSTGLTNGVLEGINSKIQLAKRRARGYRNMNNFINMIYYISADLQLNLPTLNR